MTKIKIPFDWNLDIPAVTEFTFQMDSEKAGDTEGDMDEFISFIVDLKSGEILWVHDYLEDGIAFPYASSYYIFVVGNGWYIGDDGGEDYQLYPSDDAKAEIDNYFDSPTWLKKDGGYWNIVEQVCELGSNGELKNIKISGEYNEVYEKYIKTEKPEGFM